MRITIYKPLPSLLFSTIPKATMKAWEDGFIMACLYPIKTDVSSFLFHVGGGASSPRLKAHLLLGDWTHFFKAFHPLNLTCIWDTGSVCLPRSLAVSELLAKPSLGDFRLTQSSTYLCLVAPPFLNANTWKETTKTTDLCQAGTCYFGLSEQRTQPQFPPIIPECSPRTVSPETPWNRTLWAVLTISTSILGCISDQNVFGHASFPLHHICGISVNFHAFAVIAPLCCYIGVYMSQI